jgi:hypothetical protein
VCLDDFPWLHLVNPDPVKPLAVAVGPGGATDVTAKISAVAFPLLSSGKTRVSAAESSSQLDGRGQVFREVLVDSALNVAGRLGVKDGQVVAEEYEAVSAASEPLPRALAYSGALEQLFALVLDPRRGGQLSIWSAPARAWTTRSLVGPRLGTPRALTFRLADQTLYALDQPAGSAWLRLLAIDPGAAVVTVLDARFLPADADAVDVAADLGGGLLVAASADGRTRVDRLVAGGGAWRVGSSATWPAALAGSVRAVERGVLFLVIGDDGLEPVILDFAEFEAP